MKDKRFILTFILLLLLQLILTKYCQIGPYIYISILPAMILCMPTGRDSWWVMTVAFLSGILVDGLADGPLGLNAAALVPVAAFQKKIIMTFIDEDLVTRHYAFSFRQYGFGKLFTALCLSQLIYFVIYVFADSSGTRSIGFNLLKILLSFLVSTAFGLLCINVLTPGTRR